MKNEAWLEAAIKAIRDSSKESSVYVGCDSIRFKKNGKWFARYATVIVVHKDSKHGCVLFHNTVVEPDYGVLQVRLITEVRYAVEAAEKVAPHLHDRHFEVHLDVNPNERYASSVAVKQAIGYVQGTLGIEPKVKPDAWAGTHAADHAVRNSPVWLENISKATH